MWKKLRITLLLYLLFLVALTSWSTRARHAEWQESLWVTIYPINGDDSEVVDRYIAALDVGTFSPIETYFVDYARPFNVAPRLPIDIKLSAEVESLPPEPPSSNSGLGVISWSLKMRWWAWRQDNYHGPSDIQLFVVYFDPSTNPRLRHSLGLQKGLLGVVNAFAEESYAGKNNVVIAHELLHTLGASDKYDPETNLPVHPNGFANPYQEPLFPQAKAELMAGRIATSATTSSMPNALKNTVIGPMTASEIGWQ